MRWIALLALVACADPPPSPTPTPKSAKSAASAAPATTAGRTPADAVHRQPTAAEAKARFDARSSRALPRQLPKAWRTAIEGLDGKVLSIRHLVFTRVDAAKPHREVDLTLRLFGEDAANDAKVDAAFKAWPAAKVEVDRVRGTPPRESQYSLRWAWEPANPPDSKPCKKPTAVALPPEAPKWLDRVTNARSTRRRIGAGVEHSKAGRTIELWMRYRNGYARDEAIGHFVKAATRQGFKRTRGDALTQRWTHPDGRRLFWSPDNGRLHLGCRIGGPVLVLTLAPGE